MAQIIEIQSLNEMRVFAHACADRVLKSQSGDKQRLLILLDGPMGAGKTQFTKFFVEAFGGEETTSPSFAIHNSYATEFPIEHFDLFRLESEEDLESTGFWDFFRQKRGVVILEWSSRLNEFGLFELLPRQWPKLAIEIEPIEKPGHVEARRLRVKDSTLGAV